VKKYGVALCKNCYVKRLDVEQPEKRARRLQYRREYYRMPVFRAGSWHDPAVQAHHAAMVKKYLQEDTNGHVSRLF
jgi:hypothetical protein